MYKFGAVAKSVRQPAPALFKRNELEELGIIGEGFFSRVLLVRQKITDKFLVLKLPKTQRSCHTQEEGELARASLLHEMHVLQQLNHPHVLRLVGQCVDGEVPNMLIEYANRGTLEELLACQNVPLDMNARVSLAHEIADGLAYIHEKGIFHKDLSSKNILIREVSDTCLAPNCISRLSAVIADFGLAVFKRVRTARRASSEDTFGESRAVTKQQCDTFSTMKTGERSGTGTKCFTVTVSDACDNEKDKNGLLRVSSMSSINSLNDDEDKDMLSRSEYGSTWWKAPEQIMGDEVPYTDRADVYSLGVLLAEIVSRLSAVPDPGLIPRHDRRHGFAIDFEKFREHPQLPRDTPPLLLTLIADCCNVEPMRRPPAKDVQLKLGKLLAKVESFADTNSNSNANSNTHVHGACTKVNVKQSRAHESLPNCASEVTLRPCKSHRSVSKAKTLLVQPGQLHENWSAKRDRDRDREREFLRAMRTVIPECTAAFDSLKVRRRSVSLNNVGLDTQTPLVT